MASNNELLGHKGAPAPSQPARRSGVKETLPAWLYHKEFPARIHHTQGSLDKAKAEGWVDSPAKLNDPPPVAIVAEEPQEVEAAPAAQEEKAPEGEVAPAPGEPAGTTAETKYACEKCGQDFKSPQARVAHGRFCKGKA